MTHSIIQDEQPYELINKDSYIDHNQVSFQFNNKNNIQHLNEESTTSSSKLIEQALIEHISSIDHEECEAGDEDSFFVCDLGEVIKSIEIWQKYLPNILPHYAVKCNTNIEIIKLLSNYGINFDCASKTEIDTILNLGIDPLRIVYANPCKTNSFIRHANQSQVNLTTVDNVQELYKLKKYHPNCGILIRIITNDETAQCRLSTKFGCDLTTCINELLPLAKELDLDIKGVAFHVGSGAKDFQSIYTAIKDARIVFDEAISMGFNMKILDIGGGFERETFQESSKMVQIAIEQFFNTEFVNQHEIKFIAEPGRFMVANAFTLATHIIARRDIKDSQEVDAMLYVNDGVYGNMNCILFDHQNPIPYVLTHENKFYYNHQSAKNFSFSIWGPTCDGLDCVAKSSKLSHDVAVGDWLYFPNLGAYTSAATTQFNGFKGEAKVIYVNSASSSSSQ